MKHTTFHHPSSIIHQPSSPLPLGGARGGLLLLLSLLLFLSCSSDSDDTNTSDQQVIAEGTDERPDWQAPLYTAFEQTMSVQILMQRELEPYVTSEDLLCATIDGEVRGLTPPSQEGTTLFFPLTVASNGGGVTVTLSYYCDKLHRIFTIPWTTFDATTPPMGEGGIYRPQFVTLQQ